ncbi:hypothetical protein BKA82DRAFT_4098340 [Pisolithus tinctorius]|nr:hypothetical protein BKA82DRAFT_4098340 [Pisolithus tinctorius]
MSSEISPDVIIDGFIAGIRPSFDAILSATAFSACLLTLLVVLFAFSTKESRQRLVFRLNVLAICVLTVNPFNPVSKGVYVASIYDSILLTRLFALYPVSNTPRITLLKIFTFPFCVKCARVIVLSIGINDYVSSQPSTLALEQDEATAWFRNPKMTAEWAMQIADNFYITTDRNPTTGVLLLMINNYVTVIGVLCATLWFSGSEWVRTRNEPLSDHMEGIASLGGKVGAEVVVIGKGSVTLGSTNSGTELGDRIQHPGQRE